MVVVAADVVRRRMSLPVQQLSDEDQQLLTSVVHMAELLGKPVIPLVVPTDNPFEALTQIARAIEARELVIGESHRGSSDRLFEQVDHPWKAEAGGDGKARSIVVRVLGSGDDVTRTLS